MNDVYDKAKSVISMMRKEGFDVVAKDLEDVMLGGSTGGETLMGLNWHIKSFMSSNSKCSETLAKAVKDIAGHLSKHLDS